MSDEQSLSTFAKNLIIPANFLRLEHITDTAAISELEHWKRDATSVLQDILHIVRTKESLPADIQSDVLFAVVPFASNYALDRDGALQAPYENESWIVSDSQVAADGKELFLSASKKSLCQHNLQAIISSPLLSPSLALITQILANKLKPIFKLSPHPNLHAETGRKVTNRPGGPLAVHDYYEEQKWKEYPGVEKIILWCVSGLQVHLMHHGFDSYSRWVLQENAYETIWHLLIPPIMALLDDYEAKNKLHGVVIVQQMLLSVPKDLLRRTGVDGLLRQVGFSLLEYTTF